MVKLGFVINKLLFVNILLFKLKLLMLFNFIFFLNYIVLFFIGILFLFCCNFKVEKLDLLVLYFCFKVVVWFVVKGMLIVYIKKFFLIIFLLVYIY